MKISVSELDLVISNTMVKDAGEAGAWRCLICNVANKQKARIRNHVETHFEANQICPICTQVCKSRESLRKHLTRRHGDQQQFWKLIYTWWTRLKIKIKFLNYKFKVHQNVQFETQDFASTKGILRLTLNCYGSEKH